TLPATPSCDGSTSATGSHRGCAACSPFSSAGGPASSSGSSGRPSSYGTRRFSINSASHVIGRRRYATADTSRNSFLIALVTGGEGWHNNHHHYQASARQGFFWWEVDPTWYFLKLGQWLDMGAT